MKKILVCALLGLPAAVYCQELTTVELGGAPAMQEPEAGASEALQRPDAQRIMSGLSAELRLSSKQEERIGAAVRKKTEEFEKLMREYEKNSAEEKKWRYKANESRYGMARIHRELPDTVREFLDDEQREAYDRLLEAERKPAAPAVAAQESAPKPAKKKKLVRRRKVQAPAGEDEAGQVMVDGDTPKPAPGKKRVLRRKASAAPAPAAEAQPAPEPPAEEPAAPAEEEGGGFYP